MADTNMRKAYGDTLLALGKENPDIVVLEADLGKSTMTHAFQEAYPERYFEMGIAEANMVSCAAGLAQCGKIPFVNSFAVFASGRTYDQIRQTVSIGNLNVKICGSSSGLSDYADGATHQDIEDLAIMRVIPNMHVFCPADAYETASCTRYMTEIAGPCYMRTSRAEVPPVTPKDEPFSPVPRVLREGKDVTVFACGYMNSVALEAAEKLAGSVSVRVVNVSTLKPLDEETVRRLAADVKCVVTCEEHSVIGGLGSAIAQALARDPKPMRFVGVEDRFGSSGRNYNQLIQKYHLTSDDVSDAVQALFEGR